MICIQTIRNSQQVPLRLWLEMWAEAYLVPAGATLTITADGPVADGRIDTEWSGEVLTIWTWAGATVTVTIDDEEVLPLFGGGWDEK